jgi:hypothetical protein
MGVALAALPQPVGAEHAALRQRLTPGKTPAQTEALQVPTACAACHADKPADWIAASLASRKDRSPWRMADQWGASLAAETALRPGDKALSAAWRAGCRALGGFIEGRSEAAYPQAGSQTLSPHGGRHQRIASHVGGPPSSAATA